MTFIYSFIYLFLFINAMKCSGKGFLFTAKARLATIVWKPLSYNEQLFRVFISPQKSYIYIALRALQHCQSWNILPKSLVTITALRDEQELQQENIYSRWLVTQLGTEGGWSLYLVLLLGCLTAHPDTEIILYTCISYSSFHCPSEATNQAEM